MNENDITDEEAPYYFTQEVVVLACVPSFVESHRGRPVVTVTIARRNTGIEPLTISVNDARRLTTKLLVALATHDDVFAQKMLDDSFASDPKGEFFWPREDELN